MELTIELNNLTKSPVGRDFFAAVAERTLAQSGLADSFKKKKVVLSLAILDEKEMRRLNRAYRQKSEPTDVLSFAEYPSARAIRNDRSREIFLGEIILCYTFIDTYARKNKLALRQELANVTAHGILHLLGFRHGARMFGIQKEVIAAVRGVK